jgi:hypothetical protein
MNNGTPLAKYFQDTVMSTMIICPCRTSHILVQNFAPGETELFLMESDLDGTGLRSKDNANGRQRQSPVCLHFVT